MSKLASAYYPPRARWYSRLLTALSILRRRSALDRIRLPKGVSFSGFVASLLVPGMGFYIRGPRVLGRLAVGLCAVLAMAFVLWLGCRAGNLAFGLLLSVHTSSLVYLFEPWLAGGRLRWRLVFSLGMLIMLAGLFYLPVRNWIQERWFMPLQANGQVTVVRRQAAPGALQRGDRIAYSFDSVSEHGLYVRSGIGLGPVLALPGDRVRFGKTAFEVNGVFRPRLGHMPASGELIVPEKHWFVWPELAIYRPGAVSEEALSATLVQLGTISEQQFIGRPCERWFWRRQL